MKRFIPFLLILSLLLLLAACGTGAQQKEITFEVTHSDGSSRTYSIQTTAATLADALLHEGLVSEDPQSPGLITLIDGELADWNDGEAWWCISKDGVSLPTGLRETLIADGEHYEAVFKRGFSD